MSNEQALREAAGIERAVAWIDKRRNDFMDEHGTHDPETGGTDLSRAGQEYVGELDEIAEGLRSLLPCDRPPSGWYCTRQRGHAGPCAALALPASAHGAEPSDADSEALKLLNSMKGYREGYQAGLDDVDEAWTGGETDDPLAEFDEIQAEYRKSHGITPGPEMARAVRKTQSMLVSWLSWHGDAIRAALAAAQAAQAGAVPVYWQWRRKADPWSPVHIHWNECHATTDDSEVRALYAAPSQPAPPLPDADLSLGYLSGSATSTPDGGTVRLNYFSVARAEAAFAVITDAIDARIAAQAVAKGGDRVA